MDGGNFKDVIIWLPMNLMCGLVLCFFFFSLISNTFIRAFSLLTFDFDLVCFSRACYGSHVFGLIFSRLLLSQRVL